VFISGVLSMGTFPLKVLPSVPWNDVPGSRNTHFGAGRSGPYPPHGACDLIAPAGTEVLAVEDGEIIRGPYWFVTYKDKSGCVTSTYAIDVVHENFIARYCEIALQLPEGLKKGYLVDEGQVIAKIGTQCGGSMLHFEMFKNTSRQDVLTDKSHDTKYAYVPQANYERRADLIDPTPYLNTWAWDLKCKLGRRMDLSV
jgi:murein DD-endopeptidase MepM/ murein hydrolase activator NlpD